MEGKTSSDGRTMYYKLRDDIIEKYGNLVYFSSLPSEREFCEIFGVSRSTVRKAMDLLEAEGKITRMKGKGAFFIGNKTNMDYRIHSGIGFYNDAFNQGKITKSKVLLQNVEHSAADIAQELEIKEGDDVFHLLRLRFVNDKVYSLTESYIPMYVYPEIIKVDFTDKSLFETFREQNIEPYASYRALEVKPASPYEAMHLEIKAGDPLFITFALTYDNDNRVIEYVTTKVMAYKTRFELNKR